MKAYARHVGVDCEFVNNGDDGVVIMETKDLPRFIAGFKEWFLKLGFSMTVEEPVYELERIEFCQAHPIFDGHSYTMVRNMKSFHKDSISLLPLTSQRVLKAWLGAVGDGGMSLTGGIPIWQDFYDLYQRSAGALSSKRRRRGASRLLDTGAMETGMLMAARGMTRSYGDVSPEARYSFWLAHGVQPDHQRAIEEKLRSADLITFSHILGRPAIPLEGFAY